MERLDKLLSHEGFGSRKDIKKLLRQSEVLINGKQVFDSSLQINLEKDQIIIDGEEVCLHSHIYLMMNKPQHTISSNKDGEHQTVFDLLDDSFHTPYLQDHLHIIGRLDMDTEGLLLFTTDGELTHRLISPKSHINKTYYCELEHPETDENKKLITRKFLEGIEVGPEDNEPGFKCQSAQIEWKSDNTALLTIYEGKYHQVKRMFLAVQNKITFLKRMSIGSLSLDPSLSPGDYKFLTQEDLDKLLIQDS